eukprot:TRINITY_DN3539_c0_g1_i14.p1 TRINITY_DN3539_c0_g1~~TRINITY_DN3539_c0_g1_i14.p1  ORF type:complete len:440 (-),score=86.20 TRINITY_DN3539_c0_g1_i14:84-1283(-)
MCIRDRRRVHGDCKSKKQYLTHIQAKMYVGGGQSQVLKDFHLQKSVVYHGHRKGATHDTLKENREGSEYHKVTSLAWGNPMKYPNQIISADEDGNLHHWDASTGRELFTFFKSKWIMDVDFEVTEGKKLACGLIDGRVLIYLANQIVKKNQRENIHKSPVQELVGHSGAILCNRFLDTNYLITGSSDSNVGLWDLENPQRFLSLYCEHTADVISISVCEDDGNIFLTGSTDLTAKIWDVRTKNAMQFSYDGHTSALSTVTFVPGTKQYFATASEDSTVKLYDVRMRGALQTFRSKEFSPIYTIAFSKSGRLLFAGSQDKNIKVWDTLEGNPSDPKTFDSQHGEGEYIKQLAVSTDGYALASAGSDGRIFIWSLQQKENAFKLDLSHIYFMSILPCLLMQ